MWAVSNLEILLETCTAHQLSGKSQNPRGPFGQWEMGHGLTSHTETRELVIHPTERAETSRHPPLREPREKGDLTQEKGAPQKKGAEWGTHLHTESASHHTWKSRGWGEGRAELGAGLGAGLGASVCLPVVLVAFERNQWGPRLQTVLYTCLSLEPFSLVSCKLCQPPSWTLSNVPEPLKAKTLSCPVSRR